MQEHSEVVPVLRTWLLGLLSPAEGEALEQRLITDADAFEEIALVEQELIDQYLSGQLSEKERAGFESFFMNSEDRQRQFKIAKAFRSYVEREDPSGHRVQPARQVEPRQSARQSATNIQATNQRYPVPVQTSFLATLNAYRIPVMAAVVVLSVSVSWIAYRSIRGTDGPALAVVLEPATHTREGGGGLQQVNLPPNVRVLELHAKVPKRGSASYKATLVDADGNELVSSEMPRVDTSNSEADVIVVSVAVERLAAGQYQMNVDASYSGGPTESAASYRFVIVPAARS